MTRRGWVNNLVDINLIGLPVMDKVASEMPFTPKMVFYGNYM